MFKITGENKGTCCPEDKNTVLKNYYCQLKWPLNGWNQGFICLLHKHLIIMIIIIISVRAEFKIYDEVGHKFSILLEEWVFVQSIMSEWLSWLSSWKFIPWQSP